MNEWHPVEYQLRTSSLWLLLAAAWWIVTILNLVLALSLGGVLPLTIAVVAVVAASLFTVLTPITRRQRKGEVLLQGGLLLLREASPWWDRVSVKGQLQLRVAAIASLGDSGLLVTSNDPIWGRLRLRFATESPAEAQEFARQLDGVRDQRV